MPPEEDPPPYPGRKRRGGLREPGLRRHGPFADAALDAHAHRVAELAEQQQTGSWGDPAMRHRLRQESWRDAQRAGVHRWAISRSEGAVRTCGLIAGVDPMAGAEWRRFFGWLGHLDARTDRATPRYVVSGGPYDHVFWCAFCGPIVPVRRNGADTLDTADVDDILGRHPRLCPAP